ncbi:MAG: MarR family transcriptional regulator [Bacteroidetes bacterium]|jgi:DNA-binding MarR family transcriptional regulator|nr:MarR family transcriptional regulator [Bacteroidota bacterium]
MDTFHSRTNTFSRNVSSFFDQKLQPFGLATSYVEVMLMLQREGGLAQSSLAENLSMAPSTITRFIDKLQKKELVVKKREGRRIIVELSIKGAETAPLMKEAYNAAIDELKELVGDKFVDTVGKLLEYGNEALEKRDQEP